MSGIVGKLRAAQPLDESEKASAELFLNAYFIRLENLEYQRQKVDFEGVDTLLRRQVMVYAQSPDFQKWWARESREGFSVGFVASVNSILKS